MARPPRTPRSPRPPRPSRPPRDRSSNRAPGLPSRKQILDFIATSDQPAGKREIARAFGLSGQDKILLKALLKDMADEGLIDSAPGRAFHKSGGVPKVTVLRVVDADDSGNIFAVPEQWHAEGPPPRLRVIERGRRGALGVGDRILARTEERGQGYAAHPMKKLLRSAELVLGVVRKEGERFWLTPVEKKERRELAISDLKDAEPGDLVLCEVSGRPPRVTARVDAVLGDPFAPRSFSLIAIHKHGLRHEFRQEAIDEAHRVSQQKLGEREDLTHLPIVAIDPADARDHDDAIWAAPDEDETTRAAGRRSSPSPTSASTFAPVRSWTAKRGPAATASTSPTASSRCFPRNCPPISARLKEGQVRAAMACHLRIAKDGSLKSWRFTRAKICVAANIAYEDAQAAIDAAGEEKVEVSSPTCSMPDIEGAVPERAGARPRFSLSGALGARCWRPATSASRSSSTFPSAG